MMERKAQLMEQREQSGTCSGSAESRQKKGEAQFTLEQLFISPFTGGNAANGGNGGNGGGGAGAGIGTRGASTGSATAIDNAIVRFGEGEQLGKFRFGRQDANISIPQGGKEYAVANVGRDGVHTVSTNEIPVNFKATKDGEYTISFNPENVEFDYLHLIDNLTGADVDLLALRQAQGPASYTFTAKMTDYASRFRLVFSASGDACEPSGNFAFISNGNIIVKSEGML